MEISSPLAASLNALIADASATANGTLITLNHNQSITLNGIATTSLTAANFIIK